MRAIFDFFMEFWWWVGIIVFFAFLIIGSWIEGPAKVSRDGGVGLFVMKIAIGSLLFAIFSITLNALNWLGEMVNSAP